MAEIAGAHAPTWVGRIGVSDRFSKFCGSYDYLMRVRRLDLESVKRRAAEFLARRLPSARPRGVVRGAGRVR
ncbi:MAG: hypothetical protein U0797_01185 [Gemmataceae bacterium]